MSAQQSSTTSPLVERDAGNSDAQLTGGGPQHPSDAASSSPTPNLPLDTAELANLLAYGQWGQAAEHVSSAVADPYDGHVALALDTGVLPGLDTTLDLLTRSHDLFDVPALDLGPGSDDPSSG